MINVPVVVLVLLFILLIALIYKYSMSKPRCVATYVTGIVSKIEPIPRQKRIESVPYTARSSAIREMPLRVSPPPPPPPPPRFYQSQPQSQTSGEMPSPPPPPPPPLPASLREIPIKFEEPEPSAPPATPIEGGVKEEPETLQIGDEDIF